MIDPLSLAFQRGLLRVSVDHLYWPNFGPSDYSIGPNFAIQLGSTNTSECFPSSTEGFRRYCISPSLPDEFQVSEGIVMQNRMARLIISSNQLASELDDTPSTCSTSIPVCL